MTIRNATLISVIMLAAFVETSAMAQEVIIDTTPGGATTPWAEMQSPTTADLDLRIRRARLGFWSTFSVAGAGLMLSIAGAYAYPHCSDELNCVDDSQWQSAVLFTGGLMLVGGIVGMLTSGIILARRKRQKRRYEQEVASRVERRLRWDVEKSRVVF
jgi:hypothetical protein